MTIEQFMKDKGKKKHRHTWIDVGDQCMHCGAYSEVCKGCDAARECTADGKCEII